MGARGWTLWLGLLALEPALVLMGLLVLLGIAGDCTLSREALPAKGRLVGLTAEA